VKIILIIAIVILLVVPQQGYTLRPLTSKGNIKICLSPSLSPLQDAATNEFVTASLTFSYGQYGIPSYIAEKVAEILSGYSNDPQLDITVIREKVYKLIGTPGDPSSPFYATYGNYKTAIKPAITMALIEDYVTGPTIVDIGCDNNVLAETIAGKINARIIGTDTRDSGGKPRSPKVEFRLQNSEAEIPIRGHECIDTVLLISMIHHVDSHLIGKFFEEIKRVVKSDGRIVIVEDTYSENIEASHNCNNLLEKFFAIAPEKRDRALRIIDWIGGVLIPGDIGMHHPFNLKSMEEWEKTFEENGFEVVKKEFVGFNKGRLHLNPQGVFVLKKCPRIEQVIPELKKSSHEELETIYQIKISA